MPEMITAANEAAFGEAVLDAESCIVFFDAAWCGACRPVPKLLAKLVGDGEWPRLVRVDVDALPGLSRRYGVAGLPTLILFVRGQPAAIKIGEVDEESLQTWLETA